MTTKQNQKSLLLNKTSHVKIKSIQKNIGKDQKNNNQLKKIEFPIKNTHSDIINHPINLYSNILKKLDELDMNEPKENTNKLTPIDFEKYKINKKPNIINNEEYKEKASLSNPITSISNQRLLAIQKLNNKKNFNKEDIVKFTYSSNEEVNPKFHKTVVSLEENYKQDTPHDHRTRLVDDYDKYFNKKQNEVNEEIIIDKKNDEILFPSIDYFSGLYIEMRYAYGINSKSSFIYIKNKKIIGYILSDIVILESLELNQDRNQVCLDKTFLLKSENEKNALSLKEDVPYKDNSNDIYNYHPSMLILSDNENILIVYSFVNPVIIALDISKISNKQIFSNNLSMIKIITSCKLQHKYLKSCIFSPNSLFLILMTHNNNINESYISVFDYYSNTIISTTIISISLNIIKFNPYLSNFEFVTCAEKTSLFWRITNEYDLQYQYVNVNPTSTEKIISVEYTPPLSVTSKIVLLIGFDNGAIVGIDTKTNTMIFNMNMNIIKDGVSDFLQDNQRKSDIIKVDYILCSVRFFIIVSKSIIKYFKLPALSEIKHDNIELVNSNEKQMNLDGNIEYIDFDYAYSELLLITSNWNLFYVDFNDDTLLKISTFNKYFKKQIRTISEKEEDNDYTDYKQDLSISYSQRIVKIKLLSKYNPNYNIYKKTCIDSLLNDAYFIIVAYKNGFIKIYSFPENKIISTYDAVNEEINDVSCSISNSNSYSHLLISAYSTGYIRFFDITQACLLGKFISHSKNIYNHLQFLPDDSYIYAIDLNSTLHLLKIEKIKPLTVNLHEIITFQSEIIWFELDNFDAFNKFTVVSSSDVSVYNRKFSNLLKNNTYDKAIPQYYLYDKVNSKEQFDYSLKLGEEKAKVKSERFIFEYCRKSKEVYYLLSELLCEVVIRNFYLHVTVQKIVLCNFVSGMKGSYNYLCFTDISCGGIVLYPFIDDYNNEMRSLKSEACCSIGISNLDSKMRIEMSSNGKYIITYDNYGFCTYSLGYEERK